MRNLSLFFFLILLLLSLPASAQGPATGTPPFGSFGGGPDVINLANLNMHLTVPVIHKPGRGTNFDYDITFDSSVWYPSGSGGSQFWLPVGNWGWSSTSAFSTGVTGYLTYTQTTTNCFDGMGHPSGADVIVSNSKYFDPWGTIHSFSGFIEQKSGSCGNSSVNTYPGTDTTGLILNSPTGPIITKEGANITPPANPAGGAYAAAFTDRNGNSLNTNSNGTFTDTLGTTALTIAGLAPSNTTFTYTAPSGASASYTIKYTNHSVQTNFGCSGITDYGTNGTTTANLVSEIDLPDWNATTNPNSRYSFSYEATPGHSGFVTGRLASVTLPTGGTISYTYTGGSSGHITCSDGSTPGLQRTTPDTGANHWQYDRAAGTGAAYTTTITDPYSNQTKIQFQGIYETERQTYQGSTSGGTLLSTVDTCYNGTTIPCTATAAPLPITQRAVQTTIPSAGAITLVGKNVTNYNSVGVPTEIDQYTFGSGSAPTTPSTKTLITYASLPPNITAFKQQIQVTNGSGTLLAQTTNNYDETTPVAAPTGTPQLTSVTGSRGNPTSVQRCTNLASCSSSFVKSTMTYDTAGQLQSAKDQLLNQTTFSYTDNYLDDNGSNPPSNTHSTSSPTDAFATTVTPPMNGAVTFKYYYSGQLALSTDQNSNNSFNHYDLFGRLTSSYGPVLGTLRPWLLNVYASSHTQADSYLDIADTSATATASCTVCRQDELTLDGLGRATTQKLVSDPEGATKVDTVYDVRGQVKTVSHAYRNTSDVTYGIETPAYDALGRTISVKHPDTTASHAYYGPTVTAAGGVASQQCLSGTYGLGFPTLFVDESGRKRQTWTDGYGRTIEGDEPDGTGTLNSYVCYSYDPLGNLLQVVHSLTPTQTRTYAYDALSRVTSITIPERAAGATNCAITFTYDADSNLKTKTFPTPNQNTSCATTTTMTYNYDALNRLTSKTYSDTTPVVKYGYDATAITGCATTTTPPSLTDSNPKGRMTAMCDSSGATSWAHDSAGRTITEKRAIIGTSAVTQTISYSYNLDGSINTITYPSGKQVAYTVSNAQRLTAAKDPATGAAQYAFTASYAAIGALQSMITGQVSGGFGGVTESHTFNNSLEYTATKATSTAGTAMDLTLAYSLTGGDNGSVTGIANNADTGRTQTLTYDPLNRILKAVSQAASGVDCWGQTFGPDGNAADDSVGNFYKMNSGTQTNPPCTLGSLSVTVDANNHVTGTSFAYDAVGNMTGDGQTGVAYTFDDEGRMVKATPSGGPWCYVYDGNGLRVAKIQGGTGNNCSGGTVTKLYWRYISGDSLAETDGSGSLTNTAYSEYVFFTGRRIASRVNVSSGPTPNVSIFYYFADQLGSTRTITTGSGKNSDGTSQTPGLLCYDQDYTPYGQELFTTTQMSRLQTTACTPSYKFTGYERDSESGLDYAFARYYSSRLARFLSTDPLGGAAGNLQSHNAYAYTENNPTNATDPTGLTCVMHGIDENGFPTTSNPGFSCTEEDCTRLGSACTWIPDPTTTVTVTDGGDGSSGSSGQPAGGCASFYQDGVYIGNVCSGGPNSGNTGGSSTQDDRVRALANALGKTGVYQLAEPTIYACAAATNVGIAATIAAPFVVGYVVGVSVAVQKVVDNTNKWIGAKPGDTFYQYGPRDVAQAYGHTCLGTTGSNATH